MLTFSDRLQDEIDYKGITRKELSYIADVKPRALAMYLGTQKSMPPADVAVRIAKALNVSVEFLVTGKDSKSLSAYASVLNDFERLSQNNKDSISIMIHALAESDSKKMRN